MTAIRTILSLVAAKDLHLEQLDVNTSFLHGDLEEEIYMHQPQGYEVKGKEKIVCKLKKSLYGLKQALRQWYLKFDRFMSEQGYTRCHSDHCVYLKRQNDGNYIILLLYVDDILVAGSNMQEVNVLKRKLVNSFAMKYLGVAKQILDMEGDRDNRRSTIGYVFTVGGTTVSWVSKLQSVVALSTMETEYVATTKASKEMTWLQRFLDELGKKQELGKLYSAIHLAKNSAFHSKTKHIQLKYHFIRSVLEDGKLKLEKIHTSQNHANMLTKVVAREKLRFCSVSIGLQV
eukprot:PITA_13686